MQPPIGLLRRTSTGTDGSAKAEPPGAARRFQVNIDNCRTRKHDEEVGQKRPRSDSTDSASSDDSVPSSFCEKNLDFYFRGTSLLSTFDRISLGDNPDFLARAKRIASEKGGECLSISCESLITPVTFRCELGHMWSSCAPMLTGEWCKKCEVILARAASHAKEKGGRLLSSQAANEMKFECSDSHVFTVPISKFATRWCKLCRSAKLRQVKENMKQKEQQYWQEQADVQQKLFEEARRKLFPAASVQMSEQQIDSVALTSAQENFTQNSEFSLEQAFIVHKVRCCSKEFLQLKYFSPLLPRDETARIYRQLAKLLHPDKNKHPLANEAFLKVTQVYAQVVTKTTS
mmetsp:Transcript_22508/g.40550  ORF Transcript_22508/g.40550 Transcript_22508/m.40550 type:complete len:346 (+) Transcript_22508:48-1085(+)